METEIAGLVFSLSLFSHESKPPYLPPTPLRCPRRAARSKADQAQCKWWHKKYFVTPGVSSQHPLQRDLGQGCWTEGWEPPGTYMVGFKSRSALSCSTCLGDQKRRQRKLVFWAEMTTARMLIVILVITRLLEHGLLTWGAEGSWIEFRDSSLTWIRKIALYFH